MGYFTSVLKFCITDPCHVDGSKEGEIEIVVAGRVVAERVIAERADRGYVLQLWWYKQGNNHEIRHFLSRCERNCN